MKRIDKPAKHLAILLAAAAYLLPSTCVNAQMGGFNMGNFQIENMFSKVQHTKMEHLESNLPVITITTDTPLNAQKKVMAKMKMDGYDGNIGIKLRGNSSLTFNQKKYTIETRDADGKEQNVSLLGMPEASSWVLLSPYNDVSMMRDPLAFHLWREMGHWGPRTQMVEVLMDGEYLGIYILSEAIKRGESRVNIDKMEATDVEGRNLTGGYLLRIDTYNEEGRGCHLPFESAWHRRRHHGQPNHMVVHLPQKEKSAARANGIYPALCGRNGTSDSIR